MSKFGEIIETPVPVLLDFYADWDQACQEMHAVLRDVAAALGDPRGNSRCGARGMDDIDNLQKRKKKATNPPWCEDDSHGQFGWRVATIPLRESVRLCEFSASA